MKYKIGDTIRIKKWEQMEKEYGLAPSFSGNKKVIRYDAYSAFF